MAKSEIHTLQIDFNLKEQAETLFSSLGLTLEEAITSLFRSIRPTWWITFFTQTDSL